MMDVEQRAQSVGGSVRLVVDRATVTASPVITLIND